MISSLLQYYPSMVTCIFTFVTFAIALYLWKQRSSSRRSPPGPFSLPIVGSIYMAWQFYRSGLQLPAFLRQLGCQLGPVFTIKLFGCNFIVLCDYDTIKEAFHHPNLNDRPRNNIGTKYLGGEGVGIASGEIWKRQRKFTLTTFRNLGLGKSSFEDIMVNECHELSKEITNHGENSSFNPTTLFPNASANVICTFAFGRRYEYRDDKFQFLLNSIDQIDRRIREVGGLQLLLPIFQYIPTKRMRELNKDLISLGNFIENIIEEHKTDFDADNPRDYIDIFMHEIQTSHDGLLSFGNLRGTVTGLFFAGSGTTSNTLRWAMYCMLRYPDVQVKVQSELDKVVGRGRKPAMSDKDSLPFTVATLLEIQRFGSTARFAGPMHVAACDTELFGYHIPEGAYLLGNLWAVLHEAGVWEDPEDFKPTRFLDEEGKVSKPKEFVPFSIGRRVCLGEPLAKIQLFIFFAHLLHRFTFVYPDGTKPLPSVEGAKPIPEFLVKAIPRSDEES